MVDKILGFPYSSVGKESACNAGDLGSIPRLGRSPGEGNGNPLQYSCLENPTDRGAWQATVHGVARVGHNLATSLRRLLLLLLDKILHRPKNFSIIKNESEIRESYDILHLKPMK